MPVLRQNQTSVSFRNKVHVILMHSFKKSQTEISLNLTEPRIEIKQTNWYQASLTMSLVIAAVHTRQVIRP